MVTPTRPTHNRSLSTRSQVGPVELPPLSNSSMSTPSIPNDNGSLQHSDKNHVHGRSRADGHYDDDDDDDDDDEDEVDADDERDGRRGRSATADFAKYEMDPRNMSPRRDSDELDQLGAEAKARLEAQAQTLQSGLLALLDRVEKVREEHDKLEGENRFLQEYIGSLMATSKITGPPSGGRGRNAGGRLK